MKTISLRQFQLKPSLYLLELPLTLTVYGKPVAIVNTFTGEIEKSVNTTLDGIEVETYTASYGSTNIPVKSTTRENRWCDCHFEKGVKYDCLLISWEDENGVSVVDKKFACPKCVEKYENMGRGKVFYL